MLDVENDTLLNLEIRILELIIDEDDCKCESRHAPPFNPECSHEVVAISLGCDPVQLKICQKAVEDYAEFKARGVKCWLCNRPAAECWREVPI